MRPPNETSGAEGLTGTVFPEKPEGLSQCGMGTSTSVFGAAVEMR